jgi:uncharacterized membrane protein YhaH (DUF805 family)
MDDFTHAPAIAPDPSELPRYFSMSQRIGRLRYFVYCLNGAIACCVMALVCYTFCLALPPHIGKLVFDISLVLIKTVAMPMLIFIMSIRRLHDLDRSGWWSLLIIIPFATFVLLALPGNKGNNRFGPPPRTNSTAIKLSAGLIPLLMYLLFFVLKDAPLQQGQAPAKAGPLPHYTP